MNVPGVDFFVYHWPIFDIDLYPNSQSRRAEIDLQESQGHSSVAEIQQLRDGAWLW